MMGWAGCTGPPRAGSRGSAWGRDGSLDDFAVARNHRGALRIGENSTRRAEAAPHPSLSPCEGAWGEGAETPCPENKEGQSCYVRPRRSRLLLPALRGEKDGDRSSDAG